MPRFDAETISNSIKCELGTFGHSLRTLGISGQKMRARVSISDRKTTAGALSGGAGISLPFGIGPGVEANRGQETVETRDIVITYNIHEDNRVNCKKRNRVEAFGILRCLEEQRPFFLDAVENEGTVTCSSQVTATAKYAANGKIQAWVVSVGASASHGTSRSFTVGITAPPK
jgi:hypothetical protein